MSYHPELQWFILTHLSLHYKLNCDTHAAAAIGLKWCIEHLITQVKHRCALPVCFNFISRHVYRRTSDVTHVFPHVCVFCRFEWAHLRACRSDVVYVIHISLLCRAPVLYISLRPDDVTSGAAASLVWRACVGGRVLDLWCSTLVMGLT